MLSGQSEPDAIQELFPDENIGWCPGPNLEFILPILQKKLSYGGRHGYC
jgi:hypothetical protein